MTQNTYWTSDTHFSHANVIKYCNRPFKNVDEMNATLIENWNKTVGKGYITQEDSARGKLGYVSNGGLILEVFFISNDSELEVFEEKYWLIAKEVSQVLIDYVKTKK